MAFLDSPVYCRNFSSRDTSLESFHTIFFRKRCMPIQTSLLLFLITYVERFTMSIISSIEYTLSICRSLDIRFLYELFIFLLYANIKIQYIQWLHIPCGVAPQFFHSKFIHQGWISPHISTTSLPHLLFSIVPCS